MKSWPYVLAGGLLLATLLALLGRVNPILELLANGHAQMLVLSLVAFVLLLVTRNVRPAAIVAFALVINGVIVAPYIFPRPDSGVASPDDQATVLQFNIFYNNEDLNAVAQHIVDSDADVAVLHELLPEQWDTLETLLTNHYPHTIAEPFRARTGQLSGGMAILSRSPLERLPVDPAYSPEDRVLLAAETELHGRMTTVIGLHPHASRFESRKITLRDTQIEGVVDLAARTTGPIIVAADMNITPTSPAYKDFLDRTQWHDPHRSVGWHSTWPAFDTPFGFPIDHVFVSNELIVTGYETGDGAGSDHRSLTAQIAFVN